MTDQPTEPLVFDHYPTLRELLREDPPVGVAFLIASVDRVLLFQSKYGYSLYPRIGAFGIQGPKGEAVAVLMTSGEPILGVSRDNGIRALSVDTALDSSTGLGPTPTPPTKDTPPRGQKEVQASAA